MDEQITISKDHYDKLVLRSDKLRALEAGGVDNWEWFHESLIPWLKMYYPEELDDSYEDEEGD